MIKDSEIITAKTKEYIIKNYKKELTKANILTDFDVNYSFYMIGLTGLCNPSLTPLKVVKLGNKKEHEKILKIAVFNSMKELLKNYSCITMYNTFVKCDINGNAKSELKFYACDKRQKIVKNITYLMNCLLFSLNFGKKFNKNNNSLTIYSTDFVYIEKILKDVNVKVTAM